MMNSTSLKILLTAAFEGGTHTTSLAAEKKYDSFLKCYFDLDLLFILAMQRICGREISDRFRCFFLSWEYKHSLGSPVFV